MLCRQRFPHVTVLLALLLSTLPNIAQAQLRFERTGPRAGVLIWPVGPYDDYVLDKASSLSTSVRVWSPQEGEPVRVGDEWRLEILVSEGDRFFRLRYPTRIVTETSPDSGDEMVNVSRHPVVRFDGEVQSETITTESFRVLLNGEPVPGNVRVSSTKQFATFVPEAPFPPSSEIEVSLDGNVILDDEGMPIDGDGDFLPGGVGTFRFRTLPLDRIRNTNVFGFVRDSFTEEPLVGVTIRVDAFPEANVVTDAQGRFELKDMPAPDFFVHVDGSTASNAPAGMSYPSVGKPFHSSPGETIQLEMNGEPFDVYLPPIASADIQDLSPNAVTNVGLGEEGSKTLATLFPNMDPAMWEGIRLAVPPGSAIDDQGNAVSQAAIIPVPSDRIPAPLPSNLDLSLVVSIQAPGATSFDVPAPVTFPNTDNLEPGSKTFITSFDHAAGEWVITGPATVSADGMFVVSDPGIGIRAPGWHGITNTREFEMRNRKKPGLSDFEKNLAASGLNAASALVGAVDIFVPEVAVAPAGNALSVLGASLGTAADKISNDGMLSAGGKTALAVSTAGMLAPEPISGTVADVIGLGLAIDSTITSVQAARNSLGSFSDLLSQGPTDWARTIGHISDYAEEFAAHYELFEEGVLELRAVLEESGETISDPDHVARFTAAAGMVLEAQDFFETQGGGTVLTAYKKISEDFADWMAHFDEMHSEAFEVAGNAPFRVTDVDGNEVYRGVTNSEGHARFLLGAGPGNTYDITVVDPVSNGLVKITVGASAAGDRREINQYITPIDGPDMDGDGLLDEIEVVLGTSPSNSDTDGDGIGDGTEIKQGFDPLNGRIVATGVVASLELPGRVLDVSVMNANVAIAVSDKNQLDDSPAALTVIDISDIRSPVVLGQTRLSQTPRDVASEDALDLAAVADGGALTVYDISNRTRLRLLHRISINTAKIAMDEGVLYALTEQTLATYSSETGDLLAEMTLPEPGWDISVLGGKIFIAGLEALRIYEAFPTIDPASGDAEFRLIGQTALQGLDGFLGVTLFASGQYAYVKSGLGWDSIDVSDPSNPVIVGTPDVAQGNVVDLVANGSGRVLAATFGNIDNRLSVYDASDPTDVSAIQAQIETPGSPVSIEIANGLAFVADGLRRVDFINGERATGRGSFAIVNYLSFDILGEAPTVTLVPPTDHEPGVPGLQIQAGDLIRLEARSQDDVQVRSVSLLADGEVILEDVSFPWQLPFIANTVGPLTLQVEAEDTGGNLGRSEPLTLQVVPDTTVPKLVSSSPADGATRGEDFRSLQFFFDEPISEDSIHAVSLIRVNNGQALTPTSTQLTSGNRVLVVNFDSVPDGTFQIRLDQRKIRDLAGNALGTTEQVTTFTKASAGAVWISATGGSWHDPANWEGGALPQAGDSVLLTIPEGGTVVFSEGTLELGTLTATQPLVIEGGELRTTAMEVGMLNLRGGLLAAETGLSLTSGEFTNGILLDTVLTPGLEGAMLVVNTSLSFGQEVNFENVEIAEGLHVRIAARSRLEVRESFTNRGQITIGGTDDVQGTLALEAISSCACGDINLTGRQAIISWSGNSAKTFSAGTHIDFQGENGFITTSGSGELILAEEAHIEMTSTQETFFTNVIQAHSGFIIDGTLLAKGDYVSAIVEVRSPALCEVRFGEVRVEEDANLTLFNAVAQEGSKGIAAINAEYLRLDGALWQGERISVTDTELRLGGDFDLSDINALTRTGATMTRLLGRLDLEGAEFPAGSATIEGTLANGSIEGTAALADAILLIFEDMTVNGPIVLTTQLIVRGDLILNADLEVSAGENFFPPSITFDGEGVQAIRGNGTITLPPTNEFFPFPSNIQTTSNDSFVIEQGITIEGGFGGIGNLQGPFILRGTIRATGAGSVLNLLGSPFTNDGGTIQESGGGSVTTNGG